MKTFHSENIVVVREDGVTGYAQMYGQEFIIAVYRDGHRQEAIDMTVTGGRLSREAVSGSNRVLMALLKECLKVFHGRKAYCDTPDERRFNAYVRMIKRAGIEFTAHPEYRMIDWIF